MAEDSGCYATQDKTEADYFYGTEDRFLCLVGYWKTLVEALMSIDMAKAKPAHVKAQE